MRVGGGGGLAGDRVTVEADRPGLVERVGVSELGQCLLQRLHSAADVVDDGIELVGVIDAAGLARGPDSGLLDRGDGGIEIGDGGRGHREQACVAQDAVTGGQIRFLLQDVLVFDALLASSICPIRARWAASETYSVFFFRMSRAA